MCCWLEIVVVAVLKSLKIVEPQRAPQSALFNLKKLRSTDRPLNRDMILYIYVCLYIYGYGDVSELGTHWKLF